MRSAAPAEVARATTNTTTDMPITPCPNLMLECTGQEMPRYTGEPGVPVGSIETLRDRRPAGIPARMPSYSREPAPLAPLQWSRQTRQDSSIPARNRLLLHLLHLKLPIYASRRTRWFEPVKIRANRANECISVNILSGKGCVAVFASLSQRMGGQGTEAEDRREILQICSPMLRHFPTR